MAKERARDGGPGVWGRLAALVPILLLAAVMAAASFAPATDAFAAKKKKAPVAEDSVESMPDSADGEMIDVPPDSSDDPADGDDVPGDGSGPMDGTDTTSTGIKLDDQPGPPVELNGAVDIRPGTFLLQARMTADSRPISSGVVFRVYSETLAPDGSLPKLAEIGGGTAAIGLPPGDYLVHAAYGRAGATKKIHVDGVSQGDTVVLNAGGIRLTALTGKDEPLPAGLIQFDIFAPDEEGTEERAILVDNAPPERIVSLNAGVYHVVCRYGDANAVVRADIKVEPGKVTDATVYQKAARLTLKLVDQHGGEAIANTQWSIVSQGGDSVTESVGAFPSVVLAAGDYTAIARHDGRTFERTFTVESGINRDVEVIAK
jgi:hypothetical protein